MVISLPSPDVLRPGPQRTLVKALHSLYRGAGTPGTRQIVKAVMGDQLLADTVSHQTVSAMLRGKGAGKWSKLECVVRVLAGRHTPRLDAEAVAVEFLQLWEAAQAQDLVPRVDGPPTDGQFVPDTEVSAAPTAQNRDVHLDEARDGFLDGVAFAQYLYARSIGSRAELLALKATDFNVSTWIAAHRTQWSHNVARQVADDPLADRAAVANWTWRAAEYLGTLADPVGYERFSFTPKEEYLVAFAHGMRTICQAGEAARLDKSETGRRLAKSISEAWSQADLLACCGELGGGEKQAFHIAAELINIQELAPVADISMDDYVTLLEAVDQLALPLRGYVLALQAGDLSRTPDLTRELLMAQSLSSWLLRRGSKGRDRQGSQPLDEWLADRAKKLG